jgi:hypothetical protein
MKYAELNDDQKGMADDYWDGQAEDDDQRTAEQWFDDMTDDAQAHWLSDAWGVSDEIRDGEQDGAVVLCRIPVVVSMDGGERQAATMQLEVIELPEAAE